MDVQNLPKTSTELNPACWIMLYCSWSACKLPKIHAKAWVSDLRSSIKLIMIRDGRHEVLINRQYSIIHKRISAIAQPRVAPVAEDTKRLRGAMKHLKDNSFTIPVLTVIAMVFANSFTPVMSQYRGENERKWAASIQSDISNGAPAQDICNSATNAAMTSGEVSFKDWAFSVAQKYCSSASTKEEGENESNVLVLTPEASQCGLSSSQMFDISQGKRTAVVGNNCFMIFH